MSENSDRPVVVCLDDEPPILASLQRMLRKEPYEFLATAAPDQAMTWILQKSARMVIADQRMPSMSGLAFLEMVRMCSPRTIRVMLTGQSDLTGVMKISGIEAIDRLVRKPWVDEELKGVLRDLLARASRSTGSLRC